MLSIKTNIGEVTQAIRDKLAKLTDKENLPRILAFDTIELITKRIHIDGKAADDQEIGTYSKGYMALRTGGFKSTKFSKGANKGETRPKYNRSSDTKVIVSLTRQLENDYGVFEREKGYGLGFINAHNHDKARWTEATYKKKIFSLSPSEISVIEQIIQDNVSDVLK